MEGALALSDEPSASPTAISLWAKLTRDTDRRITGWHTLVDHSADVAAVLESLLAQPTIAARFARLAGRPDLDSVTRARLAALSFLHDIGKANRGFQARVDSSNPRVGHIGELAWLFSAGSAEERLRQLFRVLGLERIEAWFAEDGAGLFDTIFAHHGRPWDRERAPPSHRYWQPQEGVDPIADLAPMRDALDSWFSSAFSNGPPLPSAPAFQHAFAGLVMLADWLGSDTQFFPLACGKEENRMRFAREQAPKALQKIGLAIEDTRRRLRSDLPDFARAFGRDPRPLQSASPEPDANCVVLEAETGSGKTEAALWRFIHLFERGLVDGIYFALPTRVAATQMFKRILGFRDRVFGQGGPPAVVRAVPGQISFDDIEGHPLPDFGFEWSDDPDGGLRRARWAAEHPKRFLAAQIAVGTIDQALLGAIAVKHAHLRGTALLRHLLVVDEVHASDGYIERLLMLLLRAHVEAGGHALLLSATLGSGMRARLLGSKVPTLAEAEQIHYPALSWLVDDQERNQQIIASGSKKLIALQPLPLMDNPDVVAETALAAAKAGAKVLVIRNTVSGAVAVAHAIESLAGADHPALFRANGVATLHHGRFAPSDRLLLDEEVEHSLGHGRTGSGVVVVGTQTLEQSLDLDADLLLTDICPIDVLLQRIGRLHRHERTRPAGFESPRTMVLVPTTRNLLPFSRRARHGLGRYVYDDLRIIEATWRLIEQHPLWNIPNMNRFLVEEATHPEKLAALWDELATRDRDWLKHLEHVEGQRIGKKYAADVAGLDRSQPFDVLRMPGDERLATRLGGADRLVEFKPRIPGPFGKPVESLRIAFHLFKGQEAHVGDSPQILEASAGALTFRLGNTIFHYDRFGLVSA